MNEEIEQKGVVSVSGKILAELMACHHEQENIMAKELGFRDREDMIDSGAYPLFDPVRSVVIAKSF